MSEQITMPSTRRCAVVTGANKGIGFEICRQLDSKEIMVILTSRDERRGVEAQEKLKGFGLSDYVVFHQLDVLDHTSIASLVEFVDSKFGKLDILVNNAGIGGIVIEGNVLFLKEVLDSEIALVLDGGEMQPVQPRAKAKLIQTIEEAEKCLQTNYYGAKTVTEAFIPLLELSDSPRIVNVSSLYGTMKILSNEWAKGVLSDGETITEKNIEKVAGKFLNDCREGLLESNGWPKYIAAYKVSKAMLNAYTRIIAKKYPSFCINCVCPGFVATDMTANLGPLTAAEGAASPVKLALLPDGGPSGLFFYRDKVFSF